MNPKLWDRIQKYGGVRSRLTKQAPLVRKEPASEPLAVGIDLAAERNPCAEVPIEMPAGEWKSIVDRLGASLPALHEEMLHQLVYGSRRRAMLDSKEFSRDFWTSLLPAPTEDETPVFSREQLRRQRLKERMEANQKKMADRLTRQRLLANPNYGSF